MASRTPGNGTARSKNGARHAGGVISDAEALVTAAADRTGKEITSLRDNLHSDLEMARMQLAKLETRVKQQAASVDAFVHAKPWQSIGVAAGVGVVSGILVGALAFRR